MDLSWIAPFTLAAFAFGLGARMVGLPPLIGFLAAGFALKAFGYGGSTELHMLADAGVTLLLFAIGLKLDVRGLLKPAIWAGSSLHALAATVVVSSMVWLLALSPWGLTAGLSIGTCLVIGFGLSFSSTVLAVKVQEEAGDAAALHAKVAIGFLIMQDIFAVVFLAAAQGQVPSPWALAVIPALAVARPLLFWLLGRAGHGELLILLGFMVAAAGYVGFQLVDLKGDLGALVIGALIAGHPKTKELAKSLLSFKDLFLVGFFLTIGLEATPTWGALGMALVLIALLPAKVWLYLWLMTRFKLRARTSLLASLGLASYSEFGLIIAALGTKAGWLSPEWLAVFALTVALSFVAAAPLNARALPLYGSLANRLRRLERRERLPEERSLPLGDHKVVIFGMGGIGITCYDELRERFGDSVVGVDVNPDRVSTQVAAGRRCVIGDATDRDFWDRCETGETELILICLPKISAAVNAAEELRQRGFGGRIGAIARYPDEVQQLRDAGVDLAFGMYREAGIGLIGSVLTELEASGTTPTIADG